MGKISLAEIKEMSVEERIELVQVIWDSIAEAADESEISPELAQELDRRLEAYNCNPDAVSDWNDVMESLRKK